MRAEQVRGARSQFAAGGNRFFPEHLPLRFCAVVRWLAPFNSMLAAFAFGCYYVYAV
jgi:hypothetical protein